MDVQIGKNKVISIENKVITQICSTIKKYNYETGGILGVDTRGLASVFQFDQIAIPHFYEYCPNTLFLNNIINSEWSKSNIEFVGFVHSHLHNDKLSQQDKIYCREILKNNDFLNNILIGIIDLSESQDIIKWYLINRENVVTF